MRHSKMLNKFVDQAYQKILTSPKISPLHYQLYHLIKAELEKAEDAESLATVATALTHTLIYAETMAVFTFSGLPKIENPEHAAVCLVAHHFGESLHENMHTLTECALISQAKETSDNVINKAKFQCNSQTL